MVISKMEIKKVVDEVIPEAFYFNSKNKKFAFSWITERTDLPEECLLSVCGKTLAVTFATDTLTENSIFPKLFTFEYVTQEMAVELLNALYIYRVPNVEVKLRDIFTPQTTIISFKHLALHLYKRYVTSD